MKEGILHFINTPDPNRPVELKYLVEYEETQKWFEEQSDALIFLFDSGITKYRYLTKLALEYKRLKNTKHYELWQIGNRVGYVTYDFKKYLDEDGNVKKNPAYVWRFVGHGRPCFEETQEELRDKVLSLIQSYKEDPDDRGFNIYPYYTKYYR